MARRRDRGTGSVFERRVTTPQGKVITRYVATLELHTSDGARRRKIAYGTSRQDALEQLAKLRRDRDLLGDLPTSDPTVEQWVNLWLTEHARRLKPATKASYTSKVNEWIIPTLGKRRLSRLTPDHVRALHRTMREGGAKPNHIVGVHAVLSTILADAVREDRVARNVAKVARAPAKQKGRKGSLTIEQAVTILEAAGTTRLGTTWLAALTLGLRQGERLGLRWECVDLDAGTIDVAWALARCPWVHGCKGGCGKPARSCLLRRPDVEPTMEHVPVEANYILQRPKSADSRRIIPLPDVLIEPLRRRLKAVEQERMLYEVDHDLVWCRPDGGPLKFRDDWKTWKDLLGLVDARDLTLHEARHTAATLLHELGVDQHTITAILGHSAAITSRDYQHVSTKLAREAVNRLGTMLALPG